MVKMNLVQAVNSALMDEMGRDESVVVLGEDVGVNGGVFRATMDLQKTYGKERVIDTPLAESGIVGCAIGMALYGLRPVAEMQFQDFTWPAFDQIVSELAKFRYRSGGQYHVPLVLRAPYGGGVRGGHYHSQSAEAYFCHTAGLKVVIPSNPADTKGLLLSAIRDPDPVCFFEPKKIYRAVTGEVPEGDHPIPLGKAATVREGDDVSVITYGAMVEVAKVAADKAAAEGISVHILDLRTLVPLDIAALEAAVAKTGRVVVFNEAPRICGFAAEVSALIAERQLDLLHAPIMRVTGFDTPFPYTLEEDFMPGPNRLLRAIRKVHGY